MKYPIKPRPKLKSKLNKMNEKIYSIRDSFTEEIFKLIFSWISSSKQINSEENKKELINLFYQILEDIYKTVSTELKKVYNNIAPFQLTDIKDFTFTEDGKTLDERIEFYLDALEEKRQELISDDVLKSYAVNMYGRLLVNETNYLKNKIIFNKISPIATLLVIEGGGGDDEICAEYIDEYPADEDVPRPPYHTNCQCSYYFVETDNEDDIEDLDLEVEE